MKKLSQLLENRSINESIASSFLQKLMRSDNPEIRAFVKSLTADGLDLARTPDSAIVRLTSETAAQHLNWSGYRIIFYQPIEDRIFLDLVTVKDYRERKFKFVSTILALQKSIVLSNRSISLRNLKRTQLS